MSMTRTVSVAAIAALLALPAIAETASYDDLPSFTGLSVANGLDAEFVTGEAQSVVAEGPSKELEKLDIYVDDGILKLRRERSGWGWGGSRERVVIKVSAPTLDRLYVSSGADAEGSGMSGEEVVIEVSSGSDAVVDGVEAGTVYLSSSSGADLTASGTCDHLEAESSSGSDIDAEDLRCNSVEADASSGSDIEAYAVTAVKASASSGADIDISGNPTDIDTDKSSGGSVNVARVN